MPDAGRRSAFGHSAAKVIINRSVNHQGQKCSSPRKATHKPKNAEVDVLSYRGKQVQACRRGDTWSKLTITRSHMLWFPKGRGRADSPRLPHAADLPGAHSQHSSAIWQLRAKRNFPTSSHVRMRQLIPSELWGGSGLRCARQPRECAAGPRSELARLAMFYQAPR